MFYIEYASFRRIKDELSFFLRITFSEQSIAKRALSSRSFISKNVLNDLRIYSSYIYVFCIIHKVVVRYNLRVIMKML